MYCQTRSKNKQTNKQTNKLASIKVAPEIEIKTFVNILFSNSFLVTQTDKNVHAKTSLAP